MLRISTNVAFLILCVVTHPVWAQGPGQGPSYDVSFMDFVLSLSTGPDSVPLGLDHTVTGSGPSATKIEFEKRTFWVAAEFDGPGALIGLRVPLTDTKWAVFIDGDPVPRVIASSEEVSKGLLRLFAAPWSERIGDELVVRTPLTHQKRCVLAFDRPEVKFTATRRRFAPKTTVESFHMKDASNIFMMTGQLQNQLQGTMRPTPPSAREQEASVVVESSDCDLRLEPNAEGLLFEKKEGGGVITELTLETLAKDASLDELSQLRLKASFDGVAAIDVTLADFFAAESTAKTRLGRWHRAESNLRGIFFRRTASWPMPFAKSARLTIHNTGTRASSVLRFFRKVSPLSPQTSKRHLHGRSQMHDVAFHGAKARVPLLVAIKPTLLVCETLRFPSGIDGRDRRVVMTGDKVQSSSLSQWIRPRDRRGWLEVVEGAESDQRALLHRERALDVQVLQKGQSLQWELFWPGEGRRQFSATTLWYE